MTRRPNHHALALTPQPRRGVALILVVAVLGILFVAGAALLSQVTFSTKTLDAERQARQNDAAIAAMEELALSFLNQGFIGTDGKAYSTPSRLVAHRRGQPDVPCAGGSPPDPDCELALPTYSEVPGLHPWLDVTEPVNGDVTGFDFLPEYKLFSSMDFAIANRPGLYRATSANSWIDLRDPTNFVGIAQELDPRFPRDADGDGIPDTVDFPITDEMMPPDLQRALAERMSDDVYRLSPTGLSEPVRLWGSLKIIPHGAMADVNASHEDILARILGLTSPTDPLPLTGGPYLSQTNEWILRNRGVLPPRSLPQTRLVSDLGTHLLQPFANPFQNGMTMAQLGPPTQRRWWTFDPMTDVTDANSAWSKLMLDPTDTERYDVSHNLTTISYDDLLMRPVMKLTSDGWVNALDWMRNQEDDPNASYDAGTNPSTRFALDNYPSRYDGTVDPRLGRLQVSLPEMDSFLNSNSIPSVGDLAVLAIDNPLRMRFVRTFQDAFLLMLSNASTNSMDPVSHAVTAAMLTANLIDYADDDGADLPFGVPVIGTNGLPVPGADGTTPLIAYGFERQPFITEVYAAVEYDAAGVPVVGSTLHSFAIELYNPYSTAISLDGYALRGDPPMPGGAASDFSLAPIDVDLSGHTMLPNETLTVHSINEPSGINGPEDDFGAGPWAVDESSRIRLERTFVDAGTSINLVVDQFNVGADVLAGSGAAPTPLEHTPLAPLFVERSWQRDTSFWPTGETQWRFVVPRANESSNVGHLLGSSNGFRDTAAFPVHADVANRFTLVASYPTTGSLLLTMRYAHLYDAGGVPGINSLPFNRLGAILGRDMTTEFDRIDNGHMPVFDFAFDDSDSNPLRRLPRHRAAPAYGVLGMVEGLDSLPWGQLIFDYFTSLPITPCEPCDGMSTCSCPWYLASGSQIVNTQPWVDQGGLRVRGRININAASRVALRGLPFIKLDLLPDTFQREMAPALGVPYSLNGPYPQLWIDDDLADAIVFYREARDGNVSLIGDFEAARDPFGSPTQTFAPRRGRGFLTVGELANVSHEMVNDGRRFALDLGANAAPPGSRLASYVPAVTRLVTLSEWLTTKSHVFTVYGVIRGQHDRGNLNSLREADGKALRFQTTVNRLPMFFGRSRPERIGTRISGGYAEVRAE